MTTRRTLLKSLLAALPLWRPASRPAEASRPPVVAARPPILPPGRTTTLTIVWADDDRGRRVAGLFSEWVNGGMKMLSGLPIPDWAAEWPDLVQVNDGGHPVRAYTCGGHGPGDVPS